MTSARCTLENEMDAPFGTVLRRRFEVLGELGRGGQGVVYRVRPKGGPGEFALKFVDAADAGRLFETEELAATLHHPNIVALHAVGADQDEAGTRHRYVVYEIVPGVTLHQELQRGPLPLPRAIEVAFQVLAGLAHAHARGIAHLDVKPANILLDAERRAKIADFGLGRFVGEADEAPPPGPDDFGGTPAYCAPEQIEGRPRRASDVYAFGMMLLEMLKGFAPFANRSLPETVHLQMNVNPPPTGLHADVDHFIATCVAKAPEMRFADAGAALAALRTVAARLHLPVPITLASAPAQPLPLTSARGFTAALPRLAVAAAWLAFPVVRGAVTPRAGALGLVPWLITGAALAGWIGRRLEGDALTWSLFEGVAPHVEKAAAFCALALSVGLPAPPSDGTPPLVPFSAVFQALAGWLLIGAALKRWVEDALEDPDRAFAVLTIDGPPDLRVKLADGPAQPLPLTRVLKPGTYRVTAGSQELVLTLPEPGRARLQLPL